MDSGNSGSIQSSSGGGDEDYDSRSDSISAFFHSSSSAAALPHLPPVQRHHHHPPSPFDSLSYLDSNPNSFTYFRPPSSASPNPSNFTDIPSFIPFTNPPPPPPPPPPPAVVSPATAPRGSKKRSRASRRAPTTVLTTDTSNFRAMVQEFTGIPTAPFAGSSPFSRPRFLQSSSPFNLLNPSSFPLKMVDTSSTSSTSADPIIHFQSLLQSQLAGPRYTLPTMVPGWADGLSGQDRSQSTAGNSANVIGQRAAGGCKMNYTAPTAADLLHDKGPEGAAARGEGMLDSNWICSSD